MDSFSLYCVKDFLGKFKRNPYIQIKEDCNPIVFSNLLNDLGDKLIGYHEIDGKEYLEIGRKELSEHNILNQVNWVSTFFFKQNPKIESDEGGSYSIYDILSYDIPNTHGNRFVYVDGKCSFKTMYEYEHGLTFIDCAIELSELTPDFFSSLAFLDLYCLSLYGFLDDIEESIKEQYIYPRIWDYLKETLKSLYTEGKLKFKN